MGPAATKLKVQHLSQILRLQNQVHNSDPGGEGISISVHVMCLWCGVVCVWVWVCLCVRAPVSEIEETSFSCSRVNFKPETTFQILCESEKK